MYIRPQYLHSSVRTAMTQFMENPNKQFMFSSPLNMFSGQASWHVTLHQSEPGSTLFDSNAMQVPLSSCDQNTLAIFPQGNLSISCCISVIHLILEQRTCDVSHDMSFQTTVSLLNWIQKWRVWWQNLNLGIFRRRSSSTMGRRSVENKIVLSLNIFCVTVTQFKKDIFCCVVGRWVRLQAGSNARFNKGPCNLDVEMTAQC